MPITEAILRKVALSFPGAVEEPSYGKPAFKIEKKFFTRLRGEDASIVWIVDSIDERDNLIASHRLTDTTIRNGDQLRTAGERSYTYDARGCVVACTIPTGHRSSAEADRRLPP